ncbi:ABC transporter ATP-binding protein [Eubacterium ruminantium]|uniref:ABC transporter ATP-binding protein n=1 Tax=Eubacterium ruminantium TaxID=42322 RepID=UPI00156834D7|nr:ABC transporter ATP-binding protein [Eubacterium ruminantium]
MAGICLEAHDLCKSYIVDGYSNNVLQNINLCIDDGEFVSIMGPSGSGKSTLLYTISGMDKMTAGSVIFDGDDISKMKERELTKLRLLKMGFVFQQMYMMKKLCIMDNIVLPGYQAKLKSREEVNKKAEELLKRLGIADTADREITEVSGGQLQRACLARALINSPKVIFADEPTGALNSKASKEVLGEMIKANEAGTTVLMVTHSEKVAALSDRIIYLLDGDIQGELILGKMNAKNDDSLSETERVILREKKLRKWLEGLGW